MATWKTAFLNFTCRFITRACLSPSVKTSELLYRTETPTHLRTAMRWYHLERVRTRVVSVTVIRRACNIPHDDSEHYNTVVWAFEPRHEINIEIRECQHFSTDEFNKSTIRAWDIFCGQHTNVWVLVCEKHLYSDTILNIGTGAFRKYAFLGEINLMLLPPPPNTNNMTNIITNNYVHYLWINIIMW